MANAGMPEGLGVFVRGSFATPVRWRFALINAWASNAAREALRAHNAGCEVWLYGLPGKFSPATWRAGLPYIRRKAREIPNVVGIVPDLENGWTGSDAHDAEAAAFGTQLAETAEAGLRVGVTGFPFVPWLRALAETAGPSVFFMVQIYGRTAHDAATFATWWQRAQGAFPGRTCLAVAAWPSSPALSTAAGFRAYLAALPEAVSAAAWPAGTIPGYMREALASYDPTRPYGGGEGGSQGGDDPGPAPAPVTRRGGSAVGALLAIGGILLTAAAAAAWGR